VTDEPNEQTDERNSKEDEPKGCFEGCMWMLPGCVPIWAIALIVLPVLWLR
jgi:hypothetical protein